MQKCNFGLLCFARADLVRNESLHSPSIQIMYLHKVQDVEHLPGLQQAMRNICKSGNALQKERPLRLTCNCCNKYSKKLPW